MTSPNEPSLEPSQSPNPLPKGQGGVEPDPEHFQGFFESCLSWRTMSRAKALAAFRFLTPDEQKLARAASPLHAEECTKAKRKSLDAHKLIAEQFWIKYPHARLPDAEREQQPQMRLMAGDELAGLRVAVRIAEQRERMPPLTTSSRCSAMRTATRSPASSSPAINRICGCCLRSASGRRA